MLPRKLLVATDGSEHAMAALETALALAGRFGSSIGILHVVNVRQLEGPLLSDLSGIVGISPFLNFQRQVREALTQKGETILSAFKEVCRRRGLAAETELAEGVVSREVCRAAKAADLVCLGRRGEHAPWSGLMMGSTVEEVVRGCSRPVLVSGDSFGPLAKVLMPYDGSQTASAALSLSAEVAGGLGAALTVLNVSGSSPEGEAVLSEARSFLAGRELAVDFVHRVGEPVTAIVEAAEAAFDLVIMGAYGHSRIRELILGGTTAGVLHRVTRPVLLYR